MLDDKLQIAKENAGWKHPIELVSKGGQLGIAYQDAHEEHIFNAEYGSEGSSPNAVIRPFILDAEKVIKTAMNDEAINYLFFNGILP